MSSAGELLGTILAACPCRPIRSSRAEKWLSETELRELRLRYEATYDAYQSCVEAANVQRQGSRPTHDMLAAEAGALRELNEACTDGDRPDDPKG
jgi:hypothetical protein